MKLLISITLLFSLLSTGYSLKILALFPLHGKSHFVMCERLAKGLAERGHQLDVYSHFPLKKPLPNYNDFSLAGTLPPVMNNMSYDIVKDFKQPNMARMQSMIGEPVCNLIDLPVFQKLIKNPPKDPPYDLIIVEVFFQNCYLAFKRHLNIPMVGVVTAGLFDWLNEPLGNPFNTASTPGAWTEFNNPMSFKDRVMNTFLYHFLTYQINSHINSQDAIVKKNFGPGYPSSSELLRDIDLLLVNSHHSIDGIKPLTPGIIPVGGLHVHDDGSKLPKEVQKWLDESRQGFVYMSFGSMVRIETFPKPVVDAFYQTFKAIAPVRVLLKIAKPEDLPEGLPANVMTYSWLPQIQVLGHKNARAFITHGGLMSTQESIVQAVPMVGIPLFGDQMNNIMRYVRRNIAVMVKLEEITEANVKNAVQEVLSNPEYMSNVKALSKKFLDRPIPPMDTAAFWIEYIGRNGKSALRPPVVDLTWWQANLLDIYGVLLLAIIAIYYVTKFVLCKILSLICSKKVDNHGRNKKIQ